MKLRSPNVGDLELLFSWINDPLTIQHSRSVVPVSWETHSVWIPDKLKNPDYHFFIGIADETPCGLVWFFRNAGGVFESSLNVARECRGKGLSVPLLRSAIEANDASAVYAAEIHNSNEAAIKVFGRCGFRLAYQQPVISTYVRVC